jgi:hypothetical protein
MKSIVTWILIGTFCLRADALVSPIGLSNWATHTQHQFLHEYFQNHSSTWPRHEEKQHLKEDLVKLI